MLTVSAIVPIKDLNLQVRIRRDVEYPAKGDKDRREEASRGAKAFVGALDNLADQALTLAQTAAAMVRNSPEEAVLEALRIQMPGLSQARFAELVEIGKHPGKASRNELLRVMLAIIDDIQGKTHGGR